MDHVIPPHRPQKGRLDFIDGLRGLAIVFVLLFHAFSRWPKLYVYGNKFVGNPLFDTNRAGVNLFFIISGFVILMTLRKSRSLSDFLVRRWYRLFPAMLVCSVLILATSGLFPERPRGEIGFWDMLPGLTFIGDGIGSHHVWDALAGYIGTPVSSIEEAFWSLYVEVRFYLVFGAAYFLLGESAGIGLVLFLFLLSVLSSDKFLSLKFGSSNVGLYMVARLHQFVAQAGVADISEFLTSKTYGFFAAGALFFRFYTTQRMGYFWLALAAGLLSSFSVSKAVGANVGLTLLFGCAMFFDRLKPVLGNRVLVFIGFISYPLYLLNENMMVAMIVKIGKAFPDMPALLIPVLPMVVVCGLAWVVAKFIEPATKAFLQLRFKPAVDLPTTG